MVRLSGWPVLGVFALVPAVMMAPEAVAHPVTFKDGWAAQTFNTEKTRDHQLFYSFTNRDAIGVRHLRLAKDRYKNRTNLVQYNRLIHRWNLPRAQANIYGWVGAGTSTGTFAGTQDTVVGGLQADYETRRIYTLAKVDVLNHDHATHVATTARLGWAPYAADFDELNTWFILQGKRITGFDDKIKLTPLVRLFKGDVLGEFGVSTEGDALFTLMYHF